MNWLEELSAKSRTSKISVGPICKTPGMRIRSGGRGRGLAKGRGKGPRGARREARSSVSFGIFGGF